MKRSFTVYPAASRLLCGVALGAVAATAAGAQSLER